ncbi:MAG: ribonuclease P protein component [Candidatus Zixiibacteriota bacterium]
MMIQSLLRSGKKHTSSRLELYYDRVVPEGAGNYQVAFLISGRAGKAVARNRIKRWMREDFRKLQKHENIEGSFIVRFKGAADNASHEMLESELEDLFKSLKINA